jgi:hypothetical protein
VKSKPGGSFGSATAASDASRQLPPLKRVLV